MSYKEIPEIIFLNGLGRISGMIWVILVFYALVMAGSHENFIAVNATNTLVHLKPLSGVVFCQRGGCSDFSYDKFQNVCYRMPQEHVLKICY